MFSETLRRKFLHAFKEKGHVVVPSSPVVPHEDPTLLFTNAGMNQFKDLFLGKSARDYKRAVSSQKCIRAGGKHNDLENVGHTSRHLTFFEMLGNFSFGDYFKKEAIEMAWEVVTKVFELDPAFIWATVFYEDEESFELWKKYVPEARIVRMGEKDNFWQMGETGPCGPCSELLYDRGQKFGSARNPAEDTSGERFFEFWNLVFMEFNRKSDSILEKLPKQSVDTGAGLERVVSLKMGVDSLFETDILRALIAEVENVFHMKYDIKDTKLSPAFRVIADHLRSLSFAIADGAQPGNIERGYVLRKILRRAVRYGRMLGREEPFLGKILPRLIATMGSDYPELKAAENRIVEILTIEEENFFRTLKRGGNMLNSIIQEAQAHGKMITGADAFKLKDTYGLPLDEIALIAIDAGLVLDTLEYEKLESEAKERSRKARKEVGEQAAAPLFAKHLAENGSTKFLGYEVTSVSTTVTALMKEGVLVDRLETGDEGMVFLKETPFYAEKGGQIGDKGVLENATTLFEVEDCQTPHPDVIVHTGVVKKGKLVVGDQLTAKVDDKRRQKIANNHTATHLLHYALQQILGAHVRQAGSVVEPARLRFDFSHHKSLSPEEILQLENLVNGMIRKNTTVEVYEISLEEASAKKEIKQFFGEKYGKQVRVVDIDHSKELCGGTHTSSTGNIGYFRIQKESSIAAGVRRIEAVTGEEAEAFARSQLESLGAEAKKRDEENEKLRSRITKLERDSLSNEAKRMVRETKGRFLVEKVEVESKELKLLADLIFEVAPSPFALALFTSGGTFLFRVSPDFGVRADEWMKEVAPILGGKGGGKADFAQGGGTNVAKIPEALEKAKEWISKKSS